VAQRPYIWFHTSRLRECLSYELRVTGTPFPFDPERAIDDWVFMCFFVGNDFLPHLPSLEIREGAIDTLIEIYKRILPKLDGYLTENGHVREAITLPALSTRLTSGAVGGALGAPGPCGQPAGGAGASRGRHLSAAAPRSHVDPAKGDDDMVANLLRDTHADDERRRKQHDKTRRPRDSGGVAAVVESARKAAAAAAPVPGLDFSNVLLMPVPPPPTSVPPGPSRPGPPVLAVAGAQAYVVVASHVAAPKSRADQQVALW
jgi:hypothetical protein